MTTVTRTLLLLAVLVLAARAQNCESAQTQFEKLLGGFLPPFYKQEILPGRCYGYLGGAQSLSNNLAYCTNEFTSEGYRAHIPTRGIGEEIASSGLFPSNTRIWTGLLYDTGLSTGFIWQDGTPAEGLEFSSTTVTFDTNPFSYMTDDLVFVQEVSNSGVPMGSCYVRKNCTVPNCRYCAFDSNDQCFQCIPGYTLSSGCANRTTRGTWLMVVGTNYEFHGRSGGADLRPVDQYVFDYLHAQGYAVVVQNAKWAGTFDANNKVGIFISPNVDSTKAEELQGLYRDSTIPLVVMSDDILSWMYWGIPTSSCTNEPGTGNPETHHIRIPSHPLAFGLGTGRQRLVEGTSDPLVCALTSGGSGITIVTSLNANANHATLAIYDKDDLQYTLMSDIEYRAQARNIFFATPDDADFTALGTQAIDNIFRYAVATPVDTLFVMDIEPKVIGLHPVADTAVTFTLDLDGGTITPADTYPGLEWGLSADNCATVPFVFNFDGVSFSVNIASGMSGDYVVCVRSFDEPAWTRQLAVRSPVSMFLTGTDEVRAISPSTIGGATATSIAALTSGRVTPHSKIAFAISDCDVPLAEFDFTGSGEAISVTASGGTSFPSAGSLIVCLSHSNPTEYVQQTTHAPSLDIHLAAEFTAISPDKFTTLEVPEIKVTGSQFTATGTQFAWVSGVPSDCTNPVNHENTYVLSEARSSITLAAAFSTPGVYHTCYTVSGGSTWVSASPELTIIEVPSTALTITEPTSLKFAAPVTSLSLTVARAGLTEFDSSLAVAVIDAADPVTSCETSTLMARLEGTTPHIVQFSSPTPISVGSKVLCLSVRSGKPNSWVKQNTGFDIIAPVSNTYLTAPSPPLVHGQGTFDLTFVSTPPSAPVTDTQIAFAPKGTNCAGVTAAETTALGDPVGSFSSGVPASYTFAFKPQDCNDATVEYEACVCNDHTFVDADDRKFVAQTGWSITVACPIVSAFTGIAPSTFLNSTVPSIVITGIAPSPETRVALSLDPECPSPFGVTTVAAPGIVNFDPSALISQLTDYFLCYSTDAAASWVPQPNVKITVTSNPVESALDTIVPATIGVGTNPSLDVTGQLSATSQIAFSLSSTCAPLYAITNVPGSTTATVSLAESISVPGEYFTCFRNSTGDGWTAQISSGSRISIVAATPTSISGASPSAFGINTTPDLTLPGLVVTPDTAFALTLTTCDAAQAFTPVSSGSGVDVTLASPIAVAGTYSVCYTTNTTLVADMVLQTGFSVTILEATTSSLTSMTPAVTDFPVGAPDTLAFFGPDAIPSPGGLIHITLSAPSCPPSPTPAALTFSFAFKTEVDLSAEPVIPSGTYMVCYSVNGGSDWAKQALTMTFHQASASAITGISPSAVGAGTDPVITFANSLQLATATIALVPTGGDCTNVGSHVTSKVIGTATSVQFNDPVVNPASQTTYDVCANEDPAVSPWIKSTGTTIVVYVASSSSITSITPSIIAVNQVNRPFTLVCSNAPTPDAIVRFSAQVDCSQRRGLLDVSSSFSSLTLAEPISATQLYAPCYSLDNGLTWIRQSSPTLLVIEATSTSIASLSPTIVGSGSVHEFAGLDTLTITPDSFAFLSPSTDCSSDIARIQIVTPVGGKMPSLAAIVGDGVYYVCYTVDNFDNSVLQQGGAITVRVITAKSNSISSVTPIIGANHVNVPVTFTGLPDEFVPALNSKIAFVPRGSPCSSGRVSETPFTPSTVDSNGMVELASPITVPGVYDVCYTVDDSLWVIQAPTVNVTVIAPTPNDVIDLQPAIISVGVPVIFDFTLNATSPSAVPSGSTFVALDVVSGNCTVANIVSASPYTSGPAQFSISGEITTPDFYRVCWSTDGGVSYVPQPDAVVEVVLTSNTTVTALSVSRVGEGEATPVTLTGAVSTPNTLVAFVPISTTGCDDETALLASQVRLSTSTTIPEITLSAGTYRICYSTDAGTIWTPQILVSLEVIDCLTATSCADCHAAEGPLCSWCTADATCRAINDAPVCTQDVLNSTVGCPTVTFTGQPSGSLAGETRVPLSSQLVFPEPIEAFTCQFVIASGVVSSNATTTSDPRVIECISPVADAAEQATFSLDFLGKPYADAVIPFRYYDCASGSCDDCASGSKPECGFCFSDNSCGPTFLCGDGSGAGPSLWSQTECSTISTLSPASGAAAGGEPITVAGTNFAEGVAYGCLFGSTQINETNWVSETEVVCTSPEARVGDLFSVSLVYRDTGAPYTVNTGVFVIQGTDATPAPSPSPLSSPYVIGGGVLAFCLLAIVIAVVIIAVTRNKSDGPEVPKLTQALLRDTIFGKGLSYPPDSRAYLPHLKPFLDLMKEDNRQAIFSVCDVTQATEADDISKAMIYIFERDNETVALISAFVRKEIKAAISQSTMFRTNSFATKMFKAYSKMVGLPYLHSTLAVLINRIMVQEGENIGAFRSSAGATDANRSKFTLLTSCQKIFNAIVRSEKSIPVQFRQIFAVVRECIGEAFPIKMENLASVVSSQMLNGLHSTREAYEEGVDSFQNLEYMDEHVTDDLEQLKHVIAPVQNLVQTFATTVQTLSVQLKKMMNACESLEGALDPSSPAARKLLEDHTNAQNSIAVGGFFFLRFLVPAITAPESYVLVTDPPLPDERRALIMVGKVLQNLSNNKEFGGKEQHMQQLNDFIFSNKAEVNALFERLCKMDVFVAPPPIEIPKKHYEAACLKLFNHANHNLLKSVENLLESPEGTPSDVIALRQQTAGNLAATIESIVNAAGNMTPELQTRFSEVRERILAVMSGARSVVRQDSSSSSSSDSGAGIAPGTPQTLVNDSPLANVDPDGGIELTAL